MNQEQVFIKMNQDTHPRYMAKGDYRYALNCRVGLSVDGSDLTVNNVYGTETCTVYEVWQDNLIHNAGLPTTGVNKLIGSVEWEQEGRLAIFVYNSLGSHCIFMYDDEDFKIYKLIESSLLGFSDDHERLVTGAAFIHDDLYFTDANGEIKHINLIDIKKYTSYASIPIDAITLIRRPPIKAPRITRKSDNLIISSTIKGKSFQFATRYVFADGSRSVLSPASELAFHIIPNAIDSYSITHFLNGSNDALKPIIDSVEFLVRDFYTLNWKIFKTVLFETNTNIATELTVDFKDDGAFSFIDVADSNRLYDTIPVNVKALEYLEDRLFIGNFSDTWGNGLLKLIKDNLSDINQVETDNSTSLNPLGLVDTFGNTQLKYSNNATYGQRVFKPDSTYGIGIVLYDEYRRKTLVLGYDLLTIKTNQQQYSIANRTSREFNINPLAIKTYLDDINNKSAYKLSSYAVVRTENLTSNWFVQGRVENVYYVIYVNNDDIPVFANNGIDGANETEKYNNVINNKYNYTIEANRTTDFTNSLANEIWFDIRNWTLYNTKLPYVFTEGDILSVLNKKIGDTYPVTDKYKIKYQRGQFVVVDNTIISDKLVLRSGFYQRIDNYTIGGSDFSGSVDNYFVTDKNDIFKQENVETSPYNNGLSAPRLIFQTNTPSALKTVKINQIKSLSVNFDYVCLVNNNKLIYSNGTQYSFETLYPNQKIVSITATRYKLLTANAYDGGVIALSEDGYVYFVENNGLFVRAIDNIPLSFGNGTYKQIEFNHFDNQIAVSWLTNGDKWNFGICSFDFTAMNSGLLFLGTTFKRKQIQDGFFVDHDLSSPPDIWNKLSGFGYVPQGLDPNPLLSEFINCYGENRFLIRTNTENKGFSITYVSDQNEDLTGFQTGDAGWRALKGAVCQTLYVDGIVRPQATGDIGLIPASPVFQYGIAFKNQSDTNSVQNIIIHDAEFSSALNEDDNSIKILAASWSGSTKEIYPVSNIDKKTTFNNRGIIMINHLASPSPHVDYELYINEDVVSSFGGNNIIDIKSTLVSAFNVGFDDVGFGFDHWDNISLFTRWEANKTDGGNDDYNIPEYRQGLGNDLEKNVAYDFGCKIEISSPRQPQENNLYYEVGNPHIYTNVDSAVQNVKFGSSDDGDCFIIQKEYRGYWWNTINETILSMNPDQNNVTQWIKVNSGINTELKPSKILNSDYDSAIRFGGQYLSGTNVNDINIFLALDEKIMPNEYGAIMKLQNTSNTLEDGNVLLSVMTEETVSIYVNKVQFNDVSGQNVVATADTVLGTFRALRGSYGTRHPESVVQHNGNVYFFDWTKGEVLQYSTNGLDSISNKGMRTYWNNVAIAINKSITPINDKRASNFYIYGGVDSENGDILFTIIENTGGIRDTLAYTVKDQAWKTFYSYVPNGYGKVNNRMIALQIVTNDFVHLFNSERTRANVVIPNNRFMGTFHDSEIQTVFNQYPNENKNPLNITVHSDECWEVKRIESDNVVNGVESNSECLNNDVDMARIDQTWYGAILRDASTPIANALIEGDVMIGKYFLVKLVNKPSFNNATTNKARLYKALLSFIKSFY